MAVVKWMERRPELCSSEGGRNRLGGEGTGDGKGNAAQSQGGVRFFLREDMDAGWGGLINTF